MRYSFDADVAVRAVVMCFEISRVKEFFDEMTCSSWRDACLTSVGLAIDGKVCKGMKLGYETAMHG